VTCTRYPTNFSLTNFSLCVSLAMFFSLHSINLCAPHLSLCVLLPPPHPLPFDGFQHQPGDRHVSLRLDFDPFSLSVLHHPPRVVMPMWHQHLSPCPPQPIISPCWVSIGAPLPARKTPSTLPGMFLAVYCADHLTYADGIAPAPSRYRRCEQLKWRHSKLVRLPVVLHVGHWLIHLFVQSPRVSALFPSRVPSIVLSLHVHVLIVVGQVSLAMFFRPSQSSCLPLLVSS
jgi:hypothetical protein